MRAMYGLLTQGCSGLAVALLVFAALAAPAREARANGGYETGPCGDQVSNCRYANTGACNTSMCNTNSSTQYACYHCAMVYAVGCNNSTCDVTCKGSYAACNGACNALGPTSCGGCNCKKVSVTLTCECSSKP